MIQEIWDEIFSQTNPFKWKTMWLCQVDFLCLNWVSTGTDSQRTYGYKRWNIFKDATIQICHLFVVSLIFYDFTTNHYWSFIPFPLI